MSASEQRWVAAWEATRRCGKRAFVWRFGVWTGGMLFLMLCVKDLLRGFWDPIAYITMFAVCLVLGYIGGLLVWTYTERCHARTTRQDSGSGKPP
jgi:hypothetical protein